MKTALVLCLLCVTGALAMSNSLRDLPSGFSSASELAQVLANEPSSASDSSRFTEVQAGCGDSCGGPAITFKDDSSSSSSSSLAGGESDDELSEFDAQIEQIDNDLKKLHDEVKESRECADRLHEQEAEVQQLLEQKHHLEKEKEKKVLQDKLEKQMKDLSEINRMSRALRLKFNELKHAQNLIKSTMMGTRGALNNLDAEPEVDEQDMKEAAEDIPQEVQEMQTAQAAVLSRSHESQQKNVKDAIEMANEAQSSVATPDDADY